MINYFATQTRKSPINLAIARVILSVSIIWKLVMYEWRAYPSWPTKLGYDNILPVFGSTPLFTHIQAVSLICILLLLSFLIGYKIKITAWSSAALLTYLGGVRIHWYGSHQTELLFTGSLLLLLFAIFAEEDVLSVDQLKRSQITSLDGLTDLYTQKKQYDHRALKWALVVIGFHYFGSGLYKLVWGDPIRWIQPASLARYIHFYNTEVYSWFAGEILLQYPILLTIGAVLAITLEVGFLPCILSRRPIWPFFVGLFGFHTAVVIYMGPNFFDLVLLFGLFFPWDTLLHWHCLVKSV